jgi:putative phosphoribosyl transferase
MKPRTQPFEDREDAANCLADLLEDLARPPWPPRDSSNFNTHTGRTLLLGLTRGGVPVAQILGRKLNLPFDLLVVRKLPVPGYPELAMGAIAEHGAAVLNQDVLRWLLDAEESLASASQRESAELERRVRLYRAGSKSPPLGGIHVVLVDDGAATGATMRAAIAAVRKAGAARVTVALPVAPKETCGELANEADDVRCLWQPEWFHSVGACYRHFPQVTDAQVRNALQPHGNQSVSVPIPVAPPSIQ